MIFKQLDFPFHFTPTKFSPGVVDLSHIAQRLLAIVGALIGLVAMIQAALSKIARERLVPIALRVLRPSIESRARKTVQRDDARLTVPCLLIRIDPADAVHLLLLDVHSLQESAERIPAEC